MIADKNKNLIPDNVDRAILKVGTVLTTGIGAVIAYLVQTGQPVPFALGLAAAIVPAILVYFAFSGGEGS